MNVFEPQPLNAFDSIEIIVLETNEPLKENFLAETQAVFLWNSCWTKAARNGGGLQIEDPVFKDFWTKYHSLHISCQDKEVCFCEHKWGGTHSTLRRDFNTRSSEPFEEKVKPVAPSMTWSNYQSRKLEKGKQPEGNPFPSWVEGVPPMILVMTPVNQNIFLWSMPNRFLNAEIDTAMKQIQENIDQIEMSPKPREP